MPPLRRPVQMLLSVTIQYNHRCTQINPARLAPQPQFLDCGGERSATPLSESGVRTKSGVATALCHRSPNTSPPNLCSSVFICGFLLSGRRTLIVVLFPRPESSVKVPPAETAISCITRRPICDVACVLCSDGLNPFPLLRTVSRTSSFDALRPTSPRVA